MSFLLSLSTLFLHSRILGRDERIDPLESQTWMKHVVFHQVMMFGHSGVVILSSLLGKPTHVRYIQNVWEL